jgi:hypothetical protein
MAGTYSDRPAVSTGHRVRERTRAALDGGFEGSDGPSDH